MADRGLDAPHGNVEIRIPAAVYAKASSGADILRDALGQARAKAGRDGRSLAGEEYGTRKDGSDLVLTFALAEKTQ